MKKILLAVTAALAITGCSQNEEIEKAVQPVEISFNTAVSKTTRATTLVNSAFTKFTAYAILLLRHLLMLQKLMR